MILNALKETAVVIFLFCLLENTAMDKRLHNVSKGITFYIPFSATFCVNILLSVGAMAYQT